jgi:hypothetical protein
MRLNLNIVSLLPRLPKLSGFRSSLSKAGR